MFIVLPILIVALATAGIFLLKSLTSKLIFTAHKDAQINSTLKFQSTQFAMALVVLTVVYLLNPENFKTFFRIGDISAPNSGVNWLGIPQGMAWWQVAAAMGFWITVATGIFMYFQLKKANAKLNMLLTFLHWVILFSAMNAFSEEAIFRIGIVSPLYGQLSVPILLLISGIMFGLPHYFGMPSGIVGALMAGFLGWLLAMSVAETHGLFLAWAVHFVQDIVIITSVFVIGHTTKS